MPFTPKPAASLPLRASSAINRPSRVPNSTRGGWARVPGQYSTPRSEGCPGPGTSYAQTSLPVSGSSARTRRYGVVTYIEPSTTSGVSSELANLPPPSVVPAGRM
jgi:hypothetical protein